MEQDRGTAASRGVVVEIAREDAPIVDGQPVLVGAFGVEKRGTPIPPATRVLRRS